jgi:DnaJ-class molecular chaperone
MEAKEQRMTYTWYPGKGKNMDVTDKYRALKALDAQKDNSYYDIKAPKPCPICEGKGTRIDKRTHKERMCVGCKGTGIM